MRETPYGFESKAAGKQRAEQELGREGWEWITTGGFTVTERWHF